MYSDNMGASVLPQRQENAGFAAVVARVGGPKCPGMHLPQGSASPWTSATAGKCGCTSRRGRPAPGLPQRQENAGFAAVVARGGGPGCPGSASRRGRSVPGLPQRQENAGFAAVVARGGGPGCPEKCLSQGSASSGASATAGKCRFRCRCGKGRRTWAGRAGRGRPQVPTR